MREIKVRVSREERLLTGASTSQLFKPEPPTMFGGFLRDGLAMNFQRKNRNEKEDRQNK